MSDEKVSRFSVSAPSNLLDKFDKIVKRLGYDDRSKAIQSAMRSLITEYTWVHEGEGVGVIALVYDHEIKNLEETLTDVQHRYENVISSSMHIHLDEHNCLQIIAVKGDSKTIQGLAKTLMTKRGVKQLKLAIVTP